MKRLCKTLQEPSSLVYQVGEWVRLRKDPTRTPYQVTADLGNEVYFLNGPTGALTGIRSTALRPLGEDDDDE